MNQDLIKKITDYLLSQAERHGVVFLILILQIYYFYNQIHRLETKVDACNNDRIEMYRSAKNEDAEVKERLIKVIENNTNTINNLKR